MGYLPRSTDELIDTIILYSIETGMITWYVCGIPTHGFANADDVSVLSQLAH